MICVTEDKKEKEGSGRHVTEYWAAFINSNKKQGISKHPQIHAQT